MKPQYTENPIKNYVQHTLADTSKAEKEIGFKAKTTLGDGYRSNYQIVSFLDGKGL